MSESSLKQFTPQIESKVDLVMMRMREEMKSRGAVDVWKWWMFMATDIIGELTFGESFKTLEQGQVSVVRLFAERLLNYRRNPNTRESSNVLHHCRRYGQLFHPSCRSRPSSRSPPSKLRKKQLRT